MENEIIKDSSLKSKKDYQTWSREITSNGVTERISVTEAENGYIVNHCKYGYRGKGDKKEYYNEEQKYVSKENPLDDEEDKSFSDSLKDIMSEIAESDGMLEVDNEKD